MKRKSFLTKVLALTMAAAIALSGCSDKAAVEESSANVESSVESSVESKVEESKTEESKVEESKVEESKTEESKTEESKSNAGNVDISQVTDWSAHYKEYFQNFSMDGKVMNFHFEGDESGMHLVFDMNIGAKDNMSIFEFGMSGQDGKQYSMSMYSLEDKSAYLELKMGDGEKSVCKTDSLMEGAVDNLNLAGDYINTDDLEKLNYVGTDTVNGVLYDVLSMKQDMDGEEAEMLYYVNRNAQELELIKVNGIENLVVEGRISPLDKVELPAGFEGAEAVDSETFATNMATGLFTIIFAAVGSGSN